MLPSWEFPGSPVVCCSVAQLNPTLCNPMEYSMPGFSVLHYLLESAKFMSIDSVMPSNHLIFCCSFHLLPSISLSIRVFSNEEAFFVRWPKYWNFSFSISPSNEYLGLISFRIDWFDILTVQGTLKSLLQHHSSKASILWHSAFFMVQLSYLYMTTGKTIALTIWVFVGKVMSLLLRALSRFIIAFLPRSNHLPTLWLQSPSPVILGPKKKKSVTVSTFSPICHRVMGLDAVIFILILSFKLAFSFFSYHVACGILVPWPGIKVGSLAMKLQSPNHWTPSTFCWRGTKILKAMWSKKKQKHNLPTSSQVLIFFLFLTEPCSFLLGKKIQYISH